MERVESKRKGGRRLIEQEREEGRGREVRREKEEKSEPC